VVALTGYVTRVAEVRVEVMAEVMAEVMVVMEVMAEVMVVMVVMEVMEETDTENAIETIEEIETDTIKEVGQVMDHTVVPMVVEFIAVMGLVYIMMATPNMVTNIML